MPAMVIQHMAWRQHRPLPVLRIAGTVRLCREGDFFRFVGQQMQWSARVATQKCEQAVFSFQACLSLLACPSASYSCMRQHLQVRNSEAANSSDSQGEDCRSAQMMTLVCPGAVSGTRRAATEGLPQQ